MHDCSRRSSDRAIIVEPVDVCRLSQRQIIDSMRKFPTCALPQIHDKAIERLYPRSAGFLRIATQVSGLLNSRAAMGRAFKAFDREGRGYVTAHAFRQIFEKVGSSPLAPESVDGLLALADPSDSGRVEYGPLVDKVFTDYERLAQRRAVERSAGAGGKKGAAASSKKK